MTGCHRSPASLYPRETTPWCLSQPRVPPWDQAEKRVRLQLRLRPAGSPALSPPLSLESSSSINRLPKNPQLRPCFQEPQSKKSISHSTAQTVVLLPTFSHVSAVTPGSSSRPQTTPVTRRSVQRPRLCPCFLSSSHVPDAIKTGWNPDPLPPCLQCLHVDTPLLEQQNMK